MAQTMLTHKCNKPVVVDVTGFLKMISPSFAIGTTGIYGLILDITLKDDKVVPEYFCTGCNKTLSQENLKEDVKAVCQVCGNPSPVDEMNVHSNISLVCTSCITAMKGDSSMSSQQSRYKGAFGITKTSRVIPLYKVLMSIKLK